MSKRYVVAVGRGITTPTDRYEAGDEVPASLVKSNPELLVQGDVEEI